MNGQVEEPEETMLTDDQKDHHQHHHTHNLYNADEHDHLDIDKYRDWFDAIMANDAQKVQDILERATRYV